MDVTRICCPQCRVPLEEAELEGALLDQGETQKDKFCPACGYHYRVLGGILDFTPDDHFYWGEISQQEMVDINQHAEQMGWFQALSSNVAGISNRDLTHYLFDQVRVAGLFHFYNPERKEAVLDLGSGWGPISFGLANFYDTVYSMDGVYERLCFQAIRARQDGVSNIRILKGTMLKLPFQENSMDTVIVNGLLEWIGLSDEVTHPKTLQKHFLHEVYRVLKPGGKLYIGIENRFGAQYLLGGRDHSGLRFTSLMPRWMANWMVKMFERRISGGGEDFSFKGTGASYRTLTYSTSGYRKLLKEANFSLPRIYWARADYNYPWISGTLDGDSLQFYLKNFKSPTHGLYSLLKHIAIRLPKGLLGLLVRSFSTDFLIVASKGKPSTGVEEQIISDLKQPRFLRTTLKTREDLNTSYWLMDGHGLEKIIEVQPRSMDGDGRRAVEIQDVVPANGHPLHTDSLPEVRSAAEWLANFQIKNQSGLWETKHLQTEMREIIERVRQYAGDADLGMLLNRYEIEYLAEVAHCSIPMVVEHGDFTPPNIIVGKNHTIQVIHWEHSKRVGNPMLDIGALILSTMPDDDESKPKANDGNTGLTAIQESYTIPFELPLHLSPGYFVLRSLVRDTGSKNLNSENYVSWKYWLHALRLALRFYLREKA